MASHVSLKLEDKEASLSQDERLPMLTKAAILRPSGGEYTGICQMHNIKPCLECGVKFIQDGIGTLGRDDLGAGTTRECIYATKDGANSLAGYSHGIETKLLRPSQQQQQQQLPAAHAQTLSCRTPRTLQRGVPPDGSSAYSESPYGFPACYFQLEPCGVQKAAVSASDALSPDLLPEYQQQQQQQQQQETKCDTPRRERHTAGISKSS